MGRAIVLVNVDDRIYALDGLCPNDGGNLADGSLIDHVLKCPLDGSAFDVRDGRLVEQPWLESGKRLGLRSYPTSQEDGCIMVDV